MSYYPGGQPPQDPYYAGQQQPDPYGPPQQPSDPYFGGQYVDPYGQGDPRYQQQTDAWYAQQQSWYAQQQAAWAQQQQAASGRSRGGSGAAVVGVLLVLLGAWFLFRDEISFNLAEVWPMIAVGLGLLMVLAAFIPRRGS